jgi:hypothetical protein
MRVTVSGVVPNLGRSGPPALRTYLFVREIPGSWPATPSSILDLCLALRARGATEVYVERERQEQSE